jgi:NAD(P)-dependent dehydrogenase (short-subunit alcohol dehydrogenase family)/acyl carrier protein
LEVTIADLAWRKLPLADTRSTLVLNYETRGQDLPVVQRDELQFHSEGTYLITGGFGGLGRKTAEWLVANGARTLVLTGRTVTESPDRQAFIAQLADCGVTVKVVACDTADFPRLSAVFAEIAAELPPLKGVFHSGAVIMDQPIADMDFATFEKVMQSKALGAWNLHLLTRSMDLEQFVVYSSLANLVGNSRQAAYSAANGFLNGLAYYRRSLGLAGTAVNWGAIADVGVVAKDEKLEQFLRYTGLRGINSAEGLQVLQQALARDVTQFGVTMITSWADWARFETRGATSPRFAKLIAADSQGKDNSLRDALVEELSKLERADQVELLAGLIVEIIASVLKSDVSSVPIDRAINLLGVDSLMATEIQLLLDNKLGVSVSILELIGDATIRSLASFAVKTLMGDANELAAATV